jgi:tetratricopeptide (TPR) repeat protein
MSADQPRPLCFVLMPGGLKPDADGLVIDFDGIYHELVTPSIRAAGLEPVRADEEPSGGIIYKPMFERLLLCDFALADVTTANANVFYELGVRHAMRPHTTVLLYAEGRRLPFDVAPLPALSYRLDAGGKPGDSEFRGKLTATLEAAREASPGSPVYQLLEGIHATEIAHAKTDIFREQVRYSTSIKERLAVARKQGPDAVAAVENELGEIADREAGVVVDLLLSYRAVKAWERMIAVTEKMPLPLRNTVMVQEQLGFALNRAGRGEDAERVLLQVLDKHGASSETYSLLGRVYKDRWEAVLREGKQALAAGVLEKAIGAYLRGFETDWRDAYPGVNAVTLMELRQPPEPRREEVLPVVRYAVERKIASGKPDYWDYATRLELAVLAKDRGGAETALADALAAIREKWEPETTARNLRLIREARSVRGEDPMSIDWIDQIERQLSGAAK